MAMSGSNTSALDDNVEIAAEAASDIIAEKVGSTNNTPGKKFLFSLRELSPLNKAQCGQRQKRHEIPDAGK